MYFTVTLQTYIKCNANRKFIMTRLLYQMRYYGKNKRPILLDKEAYLFINLFYTYLCLVKESTIKILNLIRDNVSQIDPQAEIILYGSRARGDEKIDSDWDILILIDDEATFELERTFRHHLYDLELRLGEAFSVFVFNKIDWNARFKVTDFYQNVVNEGIAI